MKKPNIILVFVDDLGYGDVSCFNENSKIHTVNIDRMAAEGLRCTDTHATSAVCTPSRYGLLTGRYNWRSRLKNLLLPGQAPALIEHDRLTLGSLLQQVGYRTAAVGKWHLGMNWTPCEGVTLDDDIHSKALWDRPDFGLDFSKPVTEGPTDRGFDYFYGLPASLSQSPHVYMENDHVIDLPDHIIGTKDNMKSILGVEYGPAAPGFDVQQVVPNCDQKVLELVDEYAKGDQPFFIYYPTPAVHTPVVPTAEFEGTSGIGIYGDFVLQLDDFVGKLNAKLRELGIEDDTLVIFTSDNGCAEQVNFPDLLSKGHNPSYVFRGMKTDIYDGGHRVPFVAKWPGVLKAGSVCTQTTSLVDLFATFAEITGAEYGDDAGEDSISNWKTWLGDTTPLREATVYHSVMGMYAIQQGPWKLELGPGSGGNSYPSPRRDDLSKFPPIQLYNMEEDIGETTNVYDQHPEIVEKLKRVLADYIMSGRSTPGEPQPCAGFENWPGLKWIKDYV